MKKRPRAIRTTLVVRAFYGRTVFAINCANRCDVSATGDPYFRFFARGNYYDSGWIIQNKLLENRCNTSCKIVEEFPPKSLENFFQNRRTGFKIAEELAPKSLKNLLQNRLKTCLITAEKRAQKSPENLLEVAKELLQNG